MTRPLRIGYPGALYHLTERGNGRAAIFLDDFDRRVFLSVVGDVVKKQDLTPLTPLAYLHRTEA
jgi:putative transposase